MKPRHTRRHTPSLENMEARALLAGNVVAVVVNGDLKIDGDNLSNAFDIVAGSAANTFIVRGRPDGKGAATKINGQSSFVAEGVTRDLKIKTLGGDDIIRLQGKSSANLVVPRDLDINTDTGKDAVSLLNTTITRTQKVKTGDGNDKLELKRTQVKGASSIDMGGGNDIVAINESLCDGSVTVLLGAGNDSCRAGGRSARQNGSQFKGRCTVKMGAGNDQVESYRSTLEAGVSWLGEAGADKVLVNESSFRSTVLADGGSERDTVDAQPNNGNSYSVLPTVKNFEIKVP